MATLHYISFFVYVSYLIRVCEGRDYILYISLLYSSGTL